jgi:hypothetical protein
MRRAETIRTSVDIPRDLHQRLHAAANRRNCSARRLILSGIERIVGEEGPTRPKRRLDLRARPLLRASGRPINPTYERIYQLVMFP